MLPFAFGSLARVSGARTSEDGAVVVVDDPHPEFAAALRDVR
ncbi:MULTISPECIES: hypothetical protein [unclassified Saccharopolyspora]|nr:MULTISPECIES: hypothetical protein [unclassified Saccharopolyspora]